MTVLASIAATLGIVLLCVASFRLGTLWQKTTADQE